MKIVIETPHVKARKTLLALVVEKMEKLGRQHARLLKGSVCLKIIRSTTTENKVCEIMVNIPGSDLFTVKHGKTFPVAVRKAIDAMQRKISEWKSKELHSKKSQVPSDEPARLRVFKRFH